MNILLSAICSYLDVDCPVDVQLTGVSTDTRSIQPGSLYIALPGKNFDGHDFIAAAIAAGAAAVITHKPCTATVPIVVVADTLWAYGQIAAMYRANFKIPFVGITGSCGKTTVTSMTAAIVQRMGNTLFPTGSFNNEVGLPKTLLGLTDAHEFAILEMGARKPGDIKYLLELVNPDVTLVNNVAPVHTETFGDLDTIARTKGEIYRYLQPNGTAIINVDDQYAPFWLGSLTAQKVLTFGLEHAADITCAYIIEEHQRIKMELVTDIGSIQILLPVLGRHNVMNALAAAAIARALGGSLDDIKDGLEEYRAVTRRLEVKSGKQGARIIDDSYNANPVAMRCAVDVLSKQQGKKIMVVGDMLELGAQSADRHKILGQQIKDAGIDVLLGYGDFSKLTVAEFGVNAKFYADKQELITALTAMLDADTVVLVKGSHGMQLNEVVNAIVA